MNHWYGVPYGTDEELPPDAGVVPPVEEEDITEKYIDLFLPKVFNELFGTGSEEEYAETLAELEIAKKRADDPVWGWYWQNQVVKLTEKLKVLEAQAQHEETKRTFDTIYRVIIATSLIGLSFAGIYLLIQKGKAEGRR